MRPARLERETFCFVDPFKPFSANSHLPTAINIFNELQPLANAPLQAKIGLFPRIVTILLQASALEPESLPPFTAICHLFQEQEVLGQKLVQFVIRQ